jgi:outer membrane protein assembly factor BamB
MDRRVYAIDLTTGDQVWDKRLPGAIIGGVALSGDTVYVGTDRPSGHLRALHLRDGKTIWDRRTPRLSIPLLLVDGLVIAHANDGIMYAFRSWDGEMEWNQELGISMTAPIDLGDGHLLATTLDSVFRLSVGDGRIVQRMQAPGSVTSHWAQIGPHVVAGTSNGTVFRLDPRELTIRWEVQVDSEVLVSPTVVGDTIFIITRPGDVYRIDPVPPPTAVLVASLELPVLAPLWRFDRWLMVGGADGVLRAIGRDGAEDWKLALWPPIAVPPIVLDDGFVAFGGVGDIHRMVGP